MTKVTILTSTERGIVPVEVDMLDGIPANPPEVSAFEGLGAFLGMTEYRSDQEPKPPRDFKDPSEKIYKGGTTG